MTMKDSTRFIDSFVRTSKDEETGNSGTFVVVERVCTYHLFRLFRFGRTFFIGKMITTFLYFWLVVIVVVVVVVRVILLKWQ